MRRGCGRAGVPERASCASSPRGSRSTSSACSASTCARLGRALRCTGIGSPRPAAGRTGHARGGGWDPQPGVFPAHQALGGCQRGRGRHGQGVASSQGSSPPGASCALRSHEPGGFGNCCKSSSSRKERTGTRPARERPAGPLRLPHPCSSACRSANRLAGFCPQRFQGTTPAPRVQSSGQSGGPSWLKPQN